MTNETDETKTVTEPVHPSVFEYDGAFRCHRCHEAWGALPGNPTEPLTCKLPLCVVEMVASEATRCLAHKTSSLNCYRAHVAKLTEERDSERSRANRYLQERVSQGTDLLRQRDAAQKDQIEIRELLGCTEDDDDYIGALRAIVASNAKLTEENAEAIALLRQVHPGEMGGTPDLFWPEGGWDAFEERLNAFLFRSTMDGGE